MEEQKKPQLELTTEQLDALVASFYPAMLDFFSSDRGKRIYAEHLQRKDKENSDTTLIFAACFY